MMSFEMVEEGEGINDEILEGETPSDDGTKDGKEGVDATEEGEVEASDESGDASNEASGDADGHINGEKQEAGDKGVPDPNVVNYGGFDFEIVNDQQLTADFKENGFDINKLNAELYGSEDFSFTKETYAALSAKFGKGIVDFHIRNLKSHSDLVVRNYQDAEAAQVNKDNAAQAKIVELAGGQDKYTSIITWAKNADSMTDDMVKSFDEAMESGSPFFQELAIKNLVDLYTKENGDELELVGGEEAADNLNPSTLTGAEFRKLLATGKYDDNPKKYDRMRNKAINLGIN